MAALLSRYFFSRRLKSRVLGSGVRVRVRLRPGVLPVYPWLCRVRVAVWVLSPLSDESFFSIVYSVTFYTDFYKSIQVDRRHVRCQGRAHPNHASRIEYSSTTRATMPESSRRRTDSSSLRLCRNVSLSSGPTRDLATQYT